MTIMQIAIFYLVALPVCIALVIGSFSILEWLRLI